VRSRRIGADGDYPDHQSHRRGLPTPTHRQTSRRQHRQVARRLTVAAAGSFSGFGAVYPAPCEGAISVAALDAPGVFAAYGTLSQDDFGMAGGAILGWKVVRPGTKLTQIRE
jgi:hypothetical protein